ncbi:hypothetical protein Y1Q_0021836 [Alligator mississippiensis]|uniref:Uncharacterized protein n=1 Tax=Alligator mississippiensis TaxID=8496 RepID=A0A151PBA4_ALLMI|nr:hypothetical protein Y1Q_0021836 [Alligator mississippiensis]
MCSKSVKRLWWTEDKERQWIDRWWQLEDGRSCKEMDRKDQILFHPVITKVQLSSHSELPNRSVLVLGESGKKDPEPKGKVPGNRIPRKERK